MTQSKGVKKYNQYWEEQAEFINKEPWAKDKIAKISLFSKCENQLKELDLSDHCISHEGGRIDIKIKVSHNFHELDDYEDKVLNLLGIEHSWLINMSLNNSNSKSSHW